jgi:hypothetical protein
MFAIDCNFTKQLQKQQFSAVPALVERSTRTSWSIQDETAKFRSDLAICTLVLKQQFESTRGSALMLKNLQKFSPSQIFRFWPFSDKRENLGERGLLFYSIVTALGGPARNCCSQDQVSLAQICEKLFTSQHNAFLIVQEGDDSIFLSTKRDMSYRRNARRACAAHDCLRLFPTYAETWRSPSRQFKFS